MFVCVCAFVCLWASRLMSGHLQHAGEAADAGPVYNRHTIKMVAVSGTRSVTFFFCSRALGSAAPSFARRFFFFFFSSEFWYLTHGGAFRASKGRQKSRIPQMAKFEPGSLSLVRRHRGYLLHFCCRSQGSPVRGVTHEVVLLQ